MLLGEESAIAKASLRRLACALRGDIRAAEPARILRLPGSKNHKYDPPRPVAVEEFRPERRYSVVDFEEALPNEPMSRDRDSNHYGQLGTIPKGSRNDTLASLAGAMRRRGISADVVQAALREQNSSRCQPPLPDDEVDRIATSISRYPPADQESEHPRSGVLDKDPKDTLMVDWSLNPPSAETCWPTSMGPAAFHGVLGDLVHIVEPQSEADPAALLIQNLVAFGNALGRRPYFAVEADEHHMNTFALVVGDTSKARKGTSIGYTRRFFRSIDEDWAEKCMVDGLSSGEGLIWHVRDPISKKCPVREKGRVVDYEPVIDDHGIEDKRLLVMESEFAKVLKVIGRDGNTLSPVVRQAWDTGSLNSLTKTSPGRATGAHISIIGHITGQELRLLLSQLEAGNGFGNRFLLVCVRRSKMLPEGGCLDETKVAPLVDRLRAAVRHAQEVAELSRDTEARQMWRDVYPRLSAGRPGLLGAMTGRAEAHVTRLSCLYALADESSIVRAKHMRAALEVWRYCYDSVRYLFGEATGNADADKLYRALQKAGPAGLTQTEISHEVFQKNFPAARIEAVCRFLEGFGLVRSMADDSAGTRPVTRWFACNPTEWASEPK